jgi:hypothetical protein
MAKEIGRSISLSPIRRLHVDLATLGLKVPTVGVERRMDLAPLAAARRACVPRPGWCALFTKALSLVANRNPHLRRAFLPFPWARLYEHGCNNVLINMERRFENEDSAFGITLRRPERFGLLELDAHLKRCKEQPVENLPGIRRYRRLAWLPVMLRRLLLRLAIDVSGRTRARFFGTFGVTTTAGAGADGLHVVSIMSANLVYGALDPAGTVNVRLLFDHRAFDGSNGARILVDLNKVLLNEILEELTSYSAQGENPCSPAD